MKRWCRALRYIWRKGGPLGILEEAEERTWRLKVIGRDVREESSHLVGRARGLEQTFNVAEDPLAEVYAKELWAHGGRLREWGWDDTKALR